MKRLFALSLVMLISLIMAGCSSQRSASSVAGQDTGKAPVSQKVPQTTAQGPTEPQKKAGIVVDPPSGWKAVEGSVLPAQYRKNTASFMAKEENFRGTTLDEVLDEAKQKFTSSFDEVVFQSDSEKIIVDGKEAAKLVFTCKVSGMQMKYEYVYLFVGSSVWAITFGDLAEPFDTLAADYEQFLQNSHFE